jgi:hypothetical protein
MRSSFLSLIMIGLALISLGVSSAAAQNASVRGQGGYSSCVCRFGYGGDNCVAAVSCAAEGGRCAQWCQAQAK